MHGFIRGLITEWRRLDLPFGGQTMIVAVSGGADSLSLLLALCELKQQKKHDLRLVAAHFDHGLRGEASRADAEFVRSIAIKHSIEFALGHAKSPSPDNLEQAARDGRYDFLTQTAENVGAFAVLTGHTINDQAETLLLNLVRGCGPTGLGGMRRIRILEEETGRHGEEEKGRMGDGGTGETFPDSVSPFLPFSSFPLLVRPLLSWARREDTEAYCHYRGVQFRYDTMNEDTAFRRVQIRKILIPVLRDMNPNIIESLANTATLVQRMMDSLPKTENKSEIELSIAELIELQPAQMESRIRSWLCERRGSARRLELKHTRAIAQLVTSTKSGRVSELPGGCVVKGGGKLRYEENKVEKKEVGI